MLVVIQLFLIFGGALCASMGSRVIARRISGLRIGASRAQFLALLLILAWAAVVGALAVLRHLAFRSTAYDLGIFDQVIWNSAQGRLFENSIMADSPSLLGHHFSPILLVLVPLYWVYSDPATLVVAQALLLATAGLPIFWLARDTLRDHVLALAVLIAYLLHPATAWIALFDFHEIAFAVPLLSFALYAWQRGRYRLFGTAIALTFLVKEEMGLIAAAVGIYLILSRRAWRAGICLIVAGSTWTWLLVRFVIPRFHPSGSYYFVAQYAKLGRSVDEIVITVLRDPLSYLGIVLDPSALTYVLHLLAPLSALPLLGLPATVITLPTLAYVLLAGTIPTDLIRYQYSAPMLPPLLAASTYGLARLRSRTGDRWSNLAPRVVAFLVAAAAIAAFLYGPLPFALGFDPQRYQPSSRIEVARELIAQIPTHASVISQNELVPHLAHRSTIQLLAYSDPALRPDYYLLDTDPRASRWPLPPNSDEQYFDMVARIESDAEYRVIADRNGYLLIERQTPLMGQPVDTTADNP